MGSPCSDSRQLNGMGGGISSLSKICVVGKSSDPHSVTFRFAQVGIKDVDIDMDETCGNLMCAVPLFAMQERLVKAKTGKPGQLNVLVQDMNTRKNVMAHFPGSLDGGVHWDDKYEISGVNGLGTRVATEYLDCGGSKTGRLWPTGRPKDTFSIGGGTVELTLIDGPNPAVFCTATELGLEKKDLSDLSFNAELLRHLEDIRLAGTIKMGIARDTEDAKRYRAIPKICVLQKTLYQEEKGIRATTLSWKCHTKLSQSLLVFPSR